MKLFDEKQFSLQLNASDKPTLAIIIVNWNAGHYLVSCLESIKNLDCSNFILKEIIVVDNASKDGSIEQIKTIYKDIVLIENDNNTGFGVACNQGAKAATADYLLFLNPDTVLPKNCLFDVFKHTREINDLSIGLLTIRQVNQEGKTLITCNKLPQFIYAVNEMIGFFKLSHKVFISTTYYDWDHESNKIVGQPMGAFYLLKRSLFNELQGFDEDFFVYSEDADLCYRLKQKGFLAYYYAGASMVHHVSATTNHIKPARFGYYLEGRMIYARKHFSRIEYLLLSVIVLLIYPVTRSIFLLFKNGFDGVKETYLGYRIFMKRFYFKKCCKKSSY